MKYLVGFFSLEWMRIFDFIAPLAIRLFLAPMLWVSGVKRLGLFSASDFVAWNPLTWLNPEAFQQNVTAMGDFSLLGMGAGTLLIVIGIIELLSAVLLVLGFAVRWVTLALIFVMVALALFAVGDAGFLSSMGQLVMMTYAELADVTGVAEATIRKWASRKLIRASGRRAGSPTFDVESVRRVAARTG